MATTQKLIDDLITEIEAAESKSSVTNIMEAKVLNWLNDYVQKNASKIDVSTTNLGKLIEGLNVALESEANDRKTAEDNLVNNLVKEEKSRKEGDELLRALTDGKAVNLGTFATMADMMSALDKMNDHTYHGIYVGNVYIGQEPITTFSFPFVLIVSVYGLKYVFQSLIINTDIYSLNKPGQYRNMGGLGIFWRRGYNGVLPETWNDNFQNYIASYSSKISEDGLYMEITFLNDKGVELLECPILKIPIGGGGGGAYTVWTTVTQIHEAVDGGEISDGSLKGDGGILDASGKYDGEIVEVPVLG